MWWLLLSCVPVDSRVLPEEALPELAPGVIVVAGSPEDVGPFQNRLADARSPYLRKHGANPVDWYPWGPEAFEEARRRGVPVFLSIGYAACHWCHVMEEESFEDVATAAFLNQHSVAVKVDRETRPDVDALYMDALRAMGNDGGWPASLWLDAEGVPFLGGTYYPKEARYGRPSFLDVLSEMSEAWQQDRAGVEGRLAQVAEVLQDRAAPPGSFEGVLGETLALGVEQVQLAWDERHAGWGAKKFPRAPAVRFLLEHGFETGDEELSGKARAMLHAMDRGGLHDHLGGGFHRYTVDRTWTVPHFEKMLYDNAQLLRLYAVGAVMLDEPRFEQVARDLVGWLERELRSPDGFMSSQDADSGGEEGTFYVWTSAQVRAVLGEDAEAFLVAYGVTEEGNFEGANVLVRVDGDPDAFAEQRAALYEARREREPPPTDDKVVVAHNGLLIGALATAGRVLDEPRWVSLAAETAEVVLASRVDGVLPRLVGPGSPPGVLEDHAFVAEGLLDLYEASGDVLWLLEAREVAAVTVERFGDSAGGFFLSAADADVPLRRKTVADGAEPSGYGRAVRVLQRLEAYGADVGGDLEAAFGAAGADLERGPGSCPTLLSALQRATTPSREVVLVASSARRDELAAWRAVVPWAPGLHLAVGVEEERLDAFSALAGKVAGPDGAPRAYVCTDKVCAAPADDLETLETQLRAR